MGKMFDMDNPVWRFMGKVTDMFFLTCLWLLFSLPVVTIGASTCALCYCSMTLASNKEGYIREDFVRAFKENFKSASVHASSGNTYRATKTKITDSTRKIQKNTVPTPPAR